MTGILNVQIKPILGNKELNLKKVEHCIKKHSNKNLDLVVLPEYFSTGIDSEYFVSNPEEEGNSSTIDYIKKLAIKYNSNIIAGTIIEQDEEKLYNTAYIINRAGEIVAKYRKIHLFNYMWGNEGEHLTSGNEEVVVDLDFGKIGLSICFDMRYPMHYNHLIKKGAEIVVSPTAWIIPKEIYKDIDLLKYAQEMWIAINRTRAYDNGVYLITSNQTGLVHNNFGCIGNSLIVSPTAEIISNAKNEEGGFYAEIDLSLVKYMRNVFPIE